MWLTDICVKRPVLATVLNLLLVVFGLIALSGIAVREYPDIDAPVVSIRTHYPGAAAEIIETQITQVIEGRIAGIQGIRAINSSSRDGLSNISIEFRLSRNIDDAANDVRDRISRVLDNLPDRADPPEVSKADSDAYPIMWLYLSSESLDRMQLSDYTDRVLVDRLGSVEGVSGLLTGGDRRPAMRIWLDQPALAARKLTPADVEDALRQQNVERPAGRIESEQREFTLRTSRAFTTPEQFEQLVVASDNDGYPVRIRDIANVERAPESLRNDFRANGVGAVGMGVVKQSKANTLEVARAVKAEIEAINRELPHDMALRVTSDFSLFIEASLKSVVRTLLQAALIVVAVIFLFLGNLRATLIPAVTLPISLVASFIFLGALGFSINILTLLALVLAIGLVVDDAIVVVENVHRRLEMGEPPLLAAYRGAREVGFAVIATTLVLIAVFAPLSMLGGNVGRLFSEFALALSAAVACSSVVALSLCPVMAAFLLQSGEHQALPQNRSQRLFQGIRHRYRNVLQQILHRHWLALGSLLLLLLGSAYLVWSLPRQVTPSEDRGQFFVQSSGPEGANFEYMDEHVSRIENLLLSRLGAGELDRMILRIPGFGSSEAVNSSTILASVVDWSQRQRSTGEIVAEINRDLSQITGVRAIAAQRGSFSKYHGLPVQFVLGGGTFQELAQWRDQLMARIAKDNPGLLRLDSDYKETKPTLDLKIDLDRAADLGVSVDQIARTVETMLSGRRVTTFIDRGQEYQVILQAERQNRATPEQIHSVYVRSEDRNALIPLSSLTQFEETASADRYNRYDRLRAVTISAALAPGYTLGEALAYVQRIVREELPGTVKLSYKGESREYRDASNALALMFVMAVVIVYLVLAAQFESWIHPLVIMTTVPLAIFGALLALFLSANTLNIYSQIGIVMLVGLAAKNGILIVEFANQRRDQGAEFTEALLESASVRLRPILMTSIATCAGVLPLVFSAGASSEARHVIGLVIFCGVAFATIFTLLMVPAFYQLLCRNTGSPGAQSEKLRIQQSQ